jgi:enamine deaminase RidA (YjgF/YER057c/UK114 family)
MIKRINSGELVSQAVIHNNTVYVSGLTAPDKSQGVEGQAQQIFDKIEGVLRAAGSDKTKILTATIWLADFGTRGLVNDIWRAWLPKEILPARAAVEAELGENVLIEVMVQAACD